MTRRTVIALGGFYLQGRNGWGPIANADSYTAAQYRVVVASYPAAAWFSLLE